MIGSQKLCIATGLAILFSLPASCSNSNNFSDFTAPTSNLSNINFNINLPAQANKKFSAYVFMGGVLKGAVLSSTVLDANGQYYARAYKVDASNCITNQLLSDGTVGTYSLHYRVDSAGSANFVSPAGCPSSAGFLSDAGLGMDFVVTLSSGNATFSVTTMAPTSQVTFNISGTGLNGVNRNTYCSIVDGGIANPTINTSSTLGFSQVGPTYTGGNAIVVTTPRVVITGQSSLGYACWIDFDGGGVYNSGDLVASGTLTNYTTAISVWNTVP